MYSCKKCNLSKSNHFLGDVYSDPLKNDLVYNPVESDYNSIFYRDEYGGIDVYSENDRFLVSLLKLYLPIHNLAWVSEELTMLILQIKGHLLNQHLPKDVLEQLNNSLGPLCIVSESWKRNFIARYNNNTLTSLEDI